MRVLQEYELASGVCMYVGIGFSGCAQRVFGPEHS